MQPLSEEYFSDYGIMTDAAIAFLYCPLGSKLALIENTLTNPLASKEDRQNGVLECYSALFERAKQLGFKAVIGFASPRHDTIIKKAVELGSVEMPDTYKMLIKIL